MVGVGGVERLPDGYVAPQQLSRGQFIYAYSLVTSLFFAWGFAYGLLDSLNKHFQSVFNISKTQSTFMQVAYFGAYFLWAPWAGAFMRKVGYKKGIYLGLTLYSLGAIFYWPVAVKKSYPGFVICTFWISMGLSTLEVAANTYLIVLGDPAQGAFRLTFSQAFNGIGAFAGPLIASEYFFKGENATSLKNVQWTYLAVSIFGAILLVLFYFAQLPEIDEGALSDTLENQDDVKPIYKQWHTIFGFFAQFAYVGAQVAVATFAVNLFSDTPSVGFTASKGALYYSYCQMVFALGRFIGAAVLKYCDPAYSLTVYALACAFFTLGITQASGNGIIACMFLVFFFESICWPTIYALAVSRLGKYTKLGGSLVVSGVGGGGERTSNSSGRSEYLACFSFIRPGTRSTCGCNRCPNVLLGLVYWVLPQCTLWIGDEHRWSTSQEDRREDR
ncbi:hypothetical protein FRC16_004104 [Serendipita sp. 398]|nr:hypothetical protein FRC16_004104 [Serendipita sp. 398]